MPATRASTLETLFAQICRATPREACDLGMLLTPTERAEMALLCYGRTHTREQGRSIASACRREDLMMAGGEAGLALFRNVEGEPDTWGWPVFAKKHVSLAG